MAGGRALRAFFRNEDSLDAETGGILLAQVISDIRAIASVFTSG